MIMEKILVTGAAGFIGFHTVNRLLRDGYEVVGLDCINDYYDINLKYDRLSTVGIERHNLEYNVKANSQKPLAYSFYKIKLEDRDAMAALFEKENFDRVIHLAAQAGVRYSLENPHAYVDSNIVGFVNILEGCRYAKVKHLVYASSSSVYGLNTKMPLATSDSIDHPISLYAASKKSNELMAHTYSHLFGIPTTGLRFFTVYGPWGRPDMALFLFTKAMIEGRPINVFNHGNMVRDFTYVDDIVEGVVRVCMNEPKGVADFDPASSDISTSSAPYKTYNIGNNDPVRLMDFIEAIERKLGETAEKNMMDIQPGDVPKTYAEVADLQRDMGYKPETSIQDGIDAFVDWYLEYYGIGERD